MDSTQARRLSRLAKRKKKAKKDERLAKIQQSQDKAYRLGYREASKYYPTCISCIKEAAKKGRSGATFKVGSWRGTSDHPAFRDINSWDEQYRVKGRAQALVEKLESDGYKVKMSYKDGGRWDTYKGVYFGGSDSYSLEINW